MLHRYPYLNSQADWAQRGRRELQAKFRDAAAEPLVGDNPVYMIGGTPSRHWRGLYKEEMGRRSRGAEELCKRVNQLTQPEMVVDGVKFRS